MKQSGEEEKNSQRGVTTCEYCSGFNSKGALDMETTSTAKSSNSLKQEIMLHLNQHLFDKGVISRDVYEQAKNKLVSPTSQTISRKRN